MYIHESIPCISTSTGFPYAFSYIYYYLRMPAKFAENDHHDHKRFGDMNL